MPKFGHFRPKSISSLILAKFHMYSISNVLISDLTLVFESFESKSPNYQKYQLSNLSEILPVSYCEGANFKFDFRF